MLVEPARIAVMKKNFTELQKKNQQNSIDTTPFEVKYDVTANTDTNGYVQCLPIIVIFQAIPG